MHLLKSNLNVHIRKEKKSPPLKDTQLRALSDLLRFVSCVPFPPPQRLIGLKLKIDETK